jgi:hypothetical protein
MNSDLDHKSGQPDDAAGSKDESICVSSREPNDDGG